MTSYAFTQSQEMVNELMRKVYLWMFVALAITGIASVYVANTPSIVNFVFSSKLTFYGTVILQLGVVIALTSMINKLSLGTAQLLFFAYSALTGVTLSSIFFVYDLDTIYTAFFATAGTFGAMSIYGYVTKRDLSGLGGFMRMALIGLVIATIINIFFASETLYWITTYAGVLIFIGLTAYDTQKIKNLLAQNPVGETTNKIAILGALSLYLDFINMFIYILRILGRRR